MKNWTKPNITNLTGKELVNSIKVHAFSSGGGDIGALSFGGLKVK